MTAAKDRNPPVVSLRSPGALQVLSCRLHPPDATLHGAAAMWFPSTCSFRAVESAEEHSTELIANIFLDPRINFVPKVPFGPDVLAGMPLAFAIDLGSGVFDQQMHCLLHPQDAMLTVSAL